MNFEIVWRFGRDSELGGRGKCTNYRKIGVGLMRVTRCHDQRAMTDGWVDDFRLTKWMMKNLTVHEPFIRLIKPNKHLSIGRIAFTIRLQSHSINWTNKTMPFPLIVGIPVDFINEIDTYQPSAPGPKGQQFNTLLLRLDIIEQQLVAMATGWTDFIKDNRIQFD